MHQRRFSRPGNAGDNGQSTDREPNVDIFQVVRARALDFDPAFDITQRFSRFSDGMANRRLQAAAGHGIFRTLDIAKRSLRDHFATVQARAGAEIDDMIRSPHRLIVVLDNDKRVPLLAQGGEGGEQTQIVTRMQSDGWFVQHVKHAAQIGTELRGQAYPLRLAAA